MGSSLVYTRPLPILNLRTSEIHLFYNLQFFYWHFLEILWLFIFLILYCCSCGDERSEGTQRPTTTTFPLLYPFPLVSALTVRSLARSTRHSLTIQPEP